MPHTPRVWLFGSSPSPATVLSEQTLTRTLHPPPLNPPSPPHPSQLAAFFGVMLAFYILYSIHSAQFHDNFLGIGPKGTKATDLEDAPTPGGGSVATLRRALSNVTADSFVNPFTGDADLRRSIGRFSGAVTRLPPATMPPLP
jgi:hypothetical protein